MKIQIFITKEEIWEACIEAELKALGEKAEDEFIYKNAALKAMTEYVKVVMLPVKNLTDHIESMNGALVHGKHFPDQVVKLFMLSKKIQNLKL